MGRNKQAGNTTVTAPDRNTLASPLAPTAPSTQAYACWPLAVSRAEKRSAFRHQPSRIDDFYGHHRNKSWLRSATAELVTIAKRQSNKSGGMRYRCSALRLVFRVGAPPPRQWFRPPLRTALVAGDDLCLQPAYRRGPFAAFICTTMLRTFRLWPTYKSSKSSAENIVGIEQISLLEIVFWVTAAVSEQLSARHYPNPFLRKL